MRIFVHGTSRETPQGTSRTTSHATPHATSRTTSRAKSRETPHATSRATSRAARRPGVKKFMSAPQAEIFRVGGMRGRFGGQMGGYGPKCDFFVTPCYSEISSRGAFWYMGSGVKTAVFGGQWGACPLPESPDLAVVGWGTHTSLIPRLRLATRCTCAPCAERLRA